jgi:hypothetical protein
VRVQHVDATGDVERNETADRWPIDRKPPLEPQALDIGSDEPLERPARTRRAQKAVESITGQKIAQINCHSFLSSWREPVGQLHDTDPLAVPCLHGASGTGARKGHASHGLRRPASAQQPLGVSAITIRLAPPSVLLRSHGFMLPASFLTGANSLASHVA